jgi:hypothetical protein
MLVNYLEWCQTRHQREGTFDWQVYAHHHQDEAKISRIQKQKMLKWAN